MGGQRPIDPLPLPPPLLRVQCKWRLHKLYIRTGLYRYVYWPHASVYNVHIGSFAGRTSQIGVEPTRQRKQNGDAPTTTTARTTRPLHARLSQPITAVVVVVVAAAAAAVVVVAVVVIKIPKAAAVTKPTQMWEELLPRETETD